MTYLSGANIERLQPIIWLVLFDDKHATQSHHQMLCGLHMAMIKHGAGMPWLYFIGMAFSGENRMFFHAVIIFTFGGEPGMIHTMKMNGMG